MKPTFRSRFALAALLVTLAPFLAGCESDELDLVGTLEMRILELGSPVSEVIVEIPVKIADEVAAGDVLVRLDSEVAEADLRAAEAALQAATASFTAAQGELERFQSLQRSNVSTQQRLDDAQRAHDEALSLRSERQARVAQARKRLADHTIRSSSAGTVDQLPFDVGERVPLGGVLAVVLAEDRPWVRVWMPARAVTSMKIGSTVDVEVLGLDQTLAGRLVEISRQPSFTPHYALTEEESAHLVYESRVEISDPPPNLRPGLTARVRASIDGASSTP